MKYTVLEKSVNNGGAPALAAYSYDDLTAAKAAYFSFLGYQLTYDGNTHVMAAILDDDGRLIESYAWYAPTETEAIRPGE